jgi:HAMP domain-containing protein
MINFFKRNKDNVLNEEIEKQEYSVLSGIIEAIEFKRTKKEIDGVLLDIEGREFQFKISPNGDLLRLSGVKEDLPLAWHICADYLKRQYGKNEINELRKELNSMMQQLHFALEEISEEISEIEIPEPAPQVITQVQSSPVIEELEPTVHNQVDEDSFEDEKDKNQLQFQDFSDEDLANHALKVLSGEIKFNAEV